MKVQTVGGVLRKGRKRLGLSQRALADIIGTKQFAIYMIEHGKRPFPKAKVCLLPEEIRGQVAELLRAEHERLLRGDAA